MITIRSLLLCFPDYAMHVHKNKHPIKNRDFPGGPVVKTSPSSAGGAGSIPGRGAKIAHAL